MTKRQRGARIAAARYNANMTQEKLSEASGIGLQALKKIEIGDQGIKGDQVVLLSEALHVSCDYILTGRTPENATIGSDLGLSELAIKTLCSIKQTYPLLLRFLEHLITDWAGQGETMERIERAIVLSDYKRRAGNDFDFGYKKLTVPMPGGGDFDIEDAINGLNVLASTNMYYQISQFIEEEVNRIAEKENNP